ncbi:MAG: RNA polymerase sigma factor [Bacteroides sp.]|nr:RNA polymerase sigma factor [Bacteroides sp.]
MLSRLQEISLIARCVAADDRRAFGQLVNAYSDPLRRFMLSLTKGDYALADDLAQETFIKAYLSIRSFEGVARFRTWLFRIAYNEFISHTRKAVPLQSLDNLTDLSDESDPSELPDTDNTITTLEEAIQSLPPQHRATIQLYYYEKFSIARISTVTGIPEGTVKSYLSRARKRLASLLQQYRY